MRKKILVKLNTVRAVGLVLVFGNLFLACDYYFNWLLFPSHPQVAKKFFLILLFSLIVLFIYSLYLFKEIHQHLDVDVFKVFRDQEKNYTTLMDNPIIDFFAYFIMILFKLQNIIDKLPDE
jgi:Ca2+/Na+ antiporter